MSEVPTSQQQAGSPRHSASPQMSLRDSGCFVLRCFIRTRFCIFVHLSNFCTTKSRTYLGAHPRSVLYYSSIPGCHAIFLALVDDSPSSVFSPPHIRKHPRFRGPLREVRDGLGLPGTRAPQPTLGVAPPSQRAMLGPAMPPPSLAQNSAVSRPALASPTGPSALTLACGARPPARAPTSRAPLQRQTLRTHRRLSHAGVAQNNGSCPRIRDDARRAVALFASERERA